MTKTFGTDQTLKLNRPYVVPVYLIHITTGIETLYFSDRNFRYNSHDYEDYITNLAGFAQSIDRFGGSLNLNAQLNFKNAAYRSEDYLADFFNTYPISRAELNLYILYADQSELPFITTDISKLILKGYLGEISNLSRSEFSVDVSSVLHYLDSKNPFTMINRTNWPLADPAAIGQFENVWYGELKGVPAHCVETGATSTLYADLSATAMGFYVSDVDYPMSFPASGTFEVQIDDERIECSAIDTGSNYITVSDRGHNSTMAAKHTKGVSVWERLATYKYMAAGHVMNSIDDVYVEGLRCIGTDYTATCDDSGKATVVFTGKKLAKHSHGAKITDILKGTGGSFTIFNSPMGEVGTSTSLRDDNPSTFCSVGVNGTFGGIKYADFSVTFPSYSPDNVEAVYACIQCNWELGWVANETFKLTAPSTIDIATSDCLKKSTTNVRLKLTGETVPTTLTARARFDAGASAFTFLVVQIFEMWVEVERYQTGGSGRTTEIMAPLVTIDGEGYKDDGSGTYTGSIGALIENPSDVRRHLLMAILGRTVGEIGTSFGTMRTLYANQISGGYLISAILSRLGSIPSQIFRALDYQTRSQMREDGGKFELTFNPITSFVKTYTADDSWFCPYGVTSVVVESWGGGGAGGGKTANGGGGGGGGGGYAKKTVTVSPGTTYPIVVGAGGVGDTGNGNNGGDSSFNTTTVVAKAGSGGGGGTETSETGGAGGTGSTGDITCNGGKGGDTTSNTCGGAGGGQAGGSTIVGHDGWDGTDSPPGTLGPGGYDPACNGGHGGNGKGTSQGDGNDAMFPGGGGGGAYRTSANHKGGDGAGGEIILIYSISITSALTLDVDNIIGEPIFGQTSADEIKNNLRGVYDLAYSTLQNNVRQKFGDYYGQIEVSDSDSISDYGELTEDIEFSATRIEDQAKDVMDWLLVQKKDILKTVRLTADWSARILERGDYFTLTWPFWTGLTWKVLGITENPVNQTFLIDAVEFKGV